MTRSLSCSRNRPPEDGTRTNAITAPTNWDHHNRRSEQLASSCSVIDQPIAALLTDLKRRRLLDETLVIWAGGGVKGGLAHGSTDDFGQKSVEDPVHIHDLHATILHLLGLDHKRLTFNFAGRDFRLTDVYGEVVNQILA